MLQRRRGILDDYYDTMRHGVHMAQEEFVICHQRVELGIRLIGTYKSLGQSNINLLWLLNIRSATAQYFYVDFGTVRRIWRLGATEYQLARQHRTCEVR